MAILDILDDDTLIITPNVIRQYILEIMDKNNVFKNIRFMSLDEVKKKIYFDYNTDALLYLMDKYNLKLANAQIYLNNLYYVNSYCNNEKVKELFTMKQELIDNNLLKFDNLFPSFLKQYKVVIYGYDYLKKDDLMIVDEIKKYTEVEIMSSLNNDELDKTLNVHEFNTITDEVRYVVYQILELIDRNVNLSNIKLIASGNDYITEIGRLFKLYNIPSDIDNSSSLYDTSYGKEILKLIENNTSFTSIIEEYKNCKYIGLIINIFNNYIEYNDMSSRLLEFIVRDFKRTKINNVNYINQVNITRLENNIFTDSDYVFVLGFNNGTYPKIVKDEDFFSDTLKRKLLLEDSRGENVLIRNSLMQKLMAIKNLSISYKLRTSFELFYPSILIGDYNFNVIHDNPISYIRYSLNDDKLLLTSFLDKYIKYGVKDKSLELFYNNIDIPYLKYDNKYKRIDKADLLKYTNNKLLLSYSTLDNFYHCKFKYLLGNILKIEKYEETLQIKIGNLFHLILSKMRDSNFEFDRYYDTYSKDYINNKKEEFYFKKLKKELKYVFDFIKIEDNVTGFNEELFENKFYVKIMDNPDVTFMGVIDKLLYNSKNKLLSILDYKTGSCSVDLRYLPIGLKMQLPSYMYLIKNVEEFKNYDIVGIYLEKIINQVGNSDNLYRDKLDALKLIGYSNSDIGKLEVFDSSYSNSEIIKSLKLKADGTFYNYSKVIDDVAISKTIEITKEKINDAVNDILDCNFEINPKRIDGVNIGCEVCKYRDICYRKEEDIEDATIAHDLSFLHD